MYRPKKCCNSNSVFFFSWRKSKPASFFIFIFRIGAFAIPGKFWKISIKGKNKRNCLNLSRSIFGVLLLHSAYSIHLFFFFGKQRTDRNPLFIGISHKPVFFCCLKNRQHNGQTVRAAWRPMERAIFINATENYVRRTIVIYWPAARPGAKTAIAILHAAMHRTSHALFKIYGARTTGPE